MAEILGKLLPFRQPRQKPRIRLLCFPFAGGAASVFRTWPNLLPDHVDVCLVELPGHGTRFGERPCDDHEALLAELSALKELPDLPTVHFGHSLGARISFALIARGLRADAFIASAARPAYLPPTSTRWNLPKDALVRELRRLGGTPKVVLDDADMVDLMLPIVRADFRILETMLADADRKLQIPMTVLAASNDAEVSRADIEKWQTHAGGSYELITLDAGHFFVQTHTDAVIAAVRRVLDETLGV